MPTEEGEVVGAVKTKLKTKQRWSIMFLARAADTEAVNTAKQEKMQVSYMVSSCKHLLKLFQISAPSAPTTTHPYTQISLTLLFLSSLW